MSLLYAGLMSGTSLDGVDAVLVEASPHGSLRAHRHRPFPAALRAELLALNTAGGKDELARAAIAAREVADVYAELLMALLAAAGTPPAAVRAVGAHGQTVRHQPQQGYTIQLLDGARLAERCGIDVVADLRSRDVAAGGQGAPLMPAFHRALFAAPGEDRAVLNLGGIANLTLLPGSGEVSGFDTGPANGLMDAWMQEQCGQPFDAGGRFAAAGRSDAALLAELLAEPWFALPAPKSTGRDQFHLAWLRERLGARALRAEDVQATLLELTARSIGTALLAAQPGTRRVLACGGGVHNEALMRRLAALLPGIEVASTAALGVDPDFIEAAGFAWLARQTLAGLPGNLPCVTGALGARVLGAIHPA